MSSLFVIKGLDQGRKFELSQDLLRLGRDSQSSIIINDREASRHHADITKTADQQFEIHDRKSSNGTFVNNRKIVSHTLRNGDRLKIGKTVLLFTQSNSSRNLKHSDLVKIVQTPLPESASRIVSSMVADGAKSARQLLGANSGQLENENLDLVYQTALAVSQTLDIDQLIDKLMQMIFEAIEPDRGCILLHDAESNEMLPRITRSKQGNQDTDQLEISRSIVDYVVQQQEGVLTSDAINDNRWDSKASIVDMGVSEAICVPMQGRYGTQGVIYVDTRTPPGKIADLATHSKLTNEHLKLMIAIGHQAALAIEDTNFYSAMIQSERMAAMGQTIAILSHHIKNILQGLNGGSYLVKSGVAENQMDVVKTGWQIVEKNQAKISQLVMDMLSFSKERKPELVEGNIESTVSDVVELLEHRARENNIEMVWSPAPDIPPCCYDPEAIHRAVLNVASNAMDALEETENGKIEFEIRLNQESQHVEIWIVDNGMGIEPESLEKIFSVFESGKGQRGTGLGLPVSQKIMNEHGGHIRVESQMGAGSKFCLHFPFQTASTERPTNESQTQESTTNEDQTHDH